MQEGFVSNINIFLCQKAYTQISDSELFGSLFDSFLVLFLRYFVKKADLFKKWHKTNCCKWLKIGGKPAKD